MQKNDLIIRSPTGKLFTSPNKREKICDSIAFHTQNAKYVLESGQLDEDMVKNAYGTYFFFNMDNGGTISFTKD